MLDLLRTRVVEPLLGLLRQGTSPRELSLCIAIGAGVGTFPVLGVSTPALTAIALWRRLNLVTIQLMSWVVAPIQLVLIIPFMRLGERIVGIPPQPLTVDEGMRLLDDGVLHAIVTLWDAIVHATIGWLLVAPIGIWLLHLSLTPLLTKLALRFSGSST